MIRTGDSIANPVTGETVTFQQTSADSDGERRDRRGHAGTRRLGRRRARPSEPDRDVPDRRWHGGVPPRSRATVRNDRRDRGREGRHRTRVLERRRRPGPSFCARSDPPWGSSACWRRCSRSPGTARPTAEACHTHFAWRRSPTTTATTFSSPSSPSQSSDWRRRSARPPHGHWPSSAPPTTAHSRVPATGTPDLLRLYAPSTHKGQPHDRSGTAIHDHPARPARRRHGRPGRSHRRRARHPRRRLPARTGDAGSNVPPSLTGTGTVVYVRNRLRADRCPIRR